MKKNESRALSQVANLRDNIQVINLKIVHYTCSFQEYDKY